jgi:hypothetical protein
MQRLILVAVTDAALLPEFARAEASVLDAAVALPPGSAGGNWGLGLAGADTLLVRRGPRIDVHVEGIARQIAEVRARQVLGFVASDGGRAAAHPVDMAQPLRHRDWLFAAAGTEQLSSRFASAVAARHPDHAIAGRRGGEGVDAVLTVVMAALGRRNARDVTDLTTRAVRLALADASQELAGLLGDTEEPGTGGLVVGLLRPPWLFAFTVAAPGASAPLPLWYRLSVGTGPDPRPGRPPRHEHLRAAVVGASEPPVGSVVVPSQHGIELGPDGLPRTFSLT